MNFELISEAAKKLVKERLNRGVSAPLIVAHAELLEYAKQFEPTLTQSDINEAAAQLTNKKAVSYNDGAYLIFRMFYIDNGKETDEYSPYLRGNNFKKFSSKEDLKGTNAIVAKYPVIGGSQTMLDKSDMGNMELYQVQGVTDTHVALGIPEDQLPNIEKIKGVRGIITNVVDEVSMDEMIASGKYWIAVS